MKMKDEVICDCGNKYFLCDVQLINFDGQLVIDGSTGLIDVEVTRDKARYKRTSRWECSKCRNPVTSNKMINLLDEYLK